MAASVYSAIIAIASELAPQGIAKSRFNAADQYHYRSIDDVLDRLSPLLAKHRLCILPRVLERTETERAGLGQGLLLQVTLRVAFELVSADDGSSHIVEAFGEAPDHADKGTAKAMSAAYKSAMLQTFCIPVSGEDADAASPRLRRPEATAEPVQGWEAWVRDIADIIGVCETEQALRLLQDRNRKLLLALSRAEPELYRTLGEAVSKRQQDLTTRAGPKPKTKAAARARAPSKTAVREPEQAGNG
jgi:hypothetical protein